ncbi:hypothetical protein I7I48_08639 [Histoplasma ohiense]|nr:hypothetical protein I7I48_08639 [Histoplasma ohiense (nom. inval.)]
MGPHRMGQFLGRHPSILASNLAGRFGPFNFNVFSEEYRHEPNPHTSFPDLQIPRAERSRNPALPRGELLSFVQYISESDPLQGVHRFVGSITTCQWLINSSCYIC